MFLGGWNDKQALDLTKFEELLEEIKSTDEINDDEKNFLIYAATRHIQFDYSVIAEYYCVASPKMQELMEEEKEKDWKLIAGTAEEGET